MGFGLFLLFTTSYFLHFTSRFPELGVIRFDLFLYVFLAILALFGKRNTTKDEGERITKALLLFFFCAVASVPFAMWPGSVIRFGLQNFLKSVLLFLYIVSFVKTQNQLKIFMAVFLGCQVFRGLEPAYMHLTQGYWGSFTTSHVGGTMEFLDRLSGAPHDIVNPNQLAWVINNILPFLYYLGWKSKQLYFRIGAVVLGGILMYPLMLTGSRTGLVTLFAIILSIAFLGEHRWKRICIICLVVGPAILLVTSLLSPDMAQRYLSLVDSSAVGADTAAGRVNSLKSNLSTAMNLHGVFGHGLGTSAEVNSHYLGSARPAHDLYIETLQEVGVVGLFLFFRYIVVILSSLNQAALYLAEEKDGYNYRLINGLQVWIFMDLIYSLACFGLTSWEWYLFGGLAVVATRLAMAKKQEKYRAKDNGVTSLALKDVA